MITEFLASFLVVRKMGASLNGQPQLGQILATEPAPEAGSLLPAPLTRLVDDVAAGGVRIIRRVRPTPRLGTILTHPPRRRRGRLARALRYVPLLGDSRREQMTLLAEDSGVEVTQSISLREAQVNRHLRFSLFSLGITSVAMVTFPPLQLLAIPSLLYITFTFFVTAYQELFVKRKINMALVDVLGIGGMLASINLFAASLTSFLTILSFKIIHRVKDNSQRSLVRVFNQHPTTVWLLIDETEMEVPFSSVQVNDLVVVQTGQMIPVDGVVVAGAGAVDQHMLTGEARLVEKGPDDEVLAATVLLAGRLVIQVQRAGDETSAARIATILQESAGFKATLQSRGETLYDNSTYPTLALSALALALVGVNGAIAVLCSAPGYTIRVAAPLALLNYLQILSHQNILVKDGAALEALTHVNVVVFDKTGTLTIDQPYVSQVHCWSEVDPDTLLAYAAAIEQRLSHPIALAIVEAADAAGLVLPAVEDARYELGYGIQATVDGQTVLVGSERFMQQSAVALPPAAEVVQAACHDQGFSLVYIALDGVCAGAVELVPTIRPEAHEAVAELKRLGLTVYIISGDQEEPTRRLAAELGIDRYFAGVLPDQKATLVESLQQGGQKVCFVGDGINDSIALRQADVSISLRGASTIATDTAQIVLMNTRLTQIAYLFNVSRELDANLKVSLGFSILPSLLSIGGVFFLHYGIIAAIIFYNVSLVLSVSNAMLPVFTHQPAFEETDDNSIIAD